jgi:hypothetical protein
MQAQSIGNDDEVWADVKVVWQLDLLVVRGLE